MLGFGSLFGSKKGGANNTSTLPTPNPNGEQRNQKKSASGYETGYQNHIAGDPSQTHRRSDVGIRSNGSLSDTQGMGSGSRENLGSIRSRLVDQFQSSLNTTISNSIHNVCKHWDSQIHNLESNYQGILEERNNFKSDNQKLASKVKALEEKIKALETEVEAKVTLFRELQSEHLKTVSSRKLAPSSSAISQVFEDLERTIKDGVFARLVRLNMDDPCIQALSRHQPFFEAVEATMVENISPSAFEAVQESERKGLLLWVIRGVIHDVLNQKIMKIHMPGLNSSELQVMQKILDIISLSEKCQGIKSVHEWRADTYRRLAYWAENVEELKKHTENSAEVGEIRQVFSDLIDGTTKDITKILEPLCDNSLKGKNFSSFITNIVHQAFQFSILIGSQTARYELRRGAGKTDDFKLVPDHLGESADTANNWNVSLFYTVPALVKTSSEDGEVYDVPELLVHGKTYALFIFGDSAKEQQDAVENATMRPTSSTNRGDLEDQNIGTITNSETSENPLNGALDETRGMQITPARPKSPTIYSSTKPLYADTLRNGFNQSATEFSEIILEQEPIVIPTYKDVGSGDQTPKNKPNGVTTSTTSGMSESDALGEAFDMASQLGSGAQGARHQGESTKAKQVITQPGSLELQSQAIQNSQKELLEDLPSSEYLPRPTEIQALSTRPKTPSITEQATLLQQETLGAIQESRSLSQDLMETEPTPPRIQTQGSATPVSHTTLAASEAETSHPQVPFGIQLQPSLKPSTPPISQNQEPTLQGELKHWQPNPQLTNSDNETSLMKTSHCHQETLSKRQRRKLKHHNGDCSPRGKGSRR
ncbi:hypothetical protein TWF718_000455 [Orbilia javanica]|uniref:Uncharacterized protein n=1 Tax=Orbilia javanica TaxID=47235 RepID=A0AAN8N4C8_9PEZI